MNLDLSHAFTVMVTQCFLGGYVMLLVDFRQPVKKWRRRWMFLAGIIVLAHIVLIAAGYFDLYARIGVLTLILPYTLATSYCSRHRGFRTVFSVANGVYVGCICGVNGYVAQALAPSLTLLPLLVRVVSLILLYFVLRRFGQTCRKMLDQLDHGWGILCLIPITTGLLTLYTNRVYFQQDPFPAAIILYGMLIICGCSYYLMYLFFERVQKETDARNDRKILEMQLSALQSRMEAVHATEDIIRAQKHDLRHRLQTAADLVIHGNKEDALRFLDAARSQLDEQKTIRWCRPPVLDAVFSSYFDQARRQGIRVEAKISLQDSLPADEGEIAIVLANALENAIHANMELPPPQREILCKAISHPSMMLEISNPCAGDIRFDDNGLPLAKQDGHGLGVRSISAFCQRHDATCQFEQFAGRFCLRIVL